MKKTMKGVLFATLVVVAGIAGLYRFFPDLLPSQNSQSGSSTADAGAPAARGSGRKRPPPLIVAGDVTSALINDRLTVLGNGTALASVSVVPLSAGLLTDVLVTAGQRVSAGATLATLDNQEQLIERDRAASALNEANTDVDRLQQLFRSNSTTEAELDRAKAELSDARLALRDAELKLSRRSVTAPIDGIVGFVSVDTGNYVTTQDELMTIDDRSTIIVEFWVPERFATQVKVGQSLVATALSSPAIEHSGTIVGIGSRIETDSRTLPVKASIENAADTLRPGMSFELSLTFAGESFPAVDPLAIQWDSAGSFVWTLADDKVLRQNVRIIQRNPESVLVDAQLKPGDQVVTEGVLALRNGISVRIEGGSSSEQTGTPAQAERRNSSATTAPAGS